MQATAQGRAKLWIDWLAFASDVPQGVELLLCNAVAEARPRDPAAAVHLDAPAELARQSLAGSPSRATFAADRLSLAVTQTGAGMKWSWNLPASIAPAGYRFVSLRYRAEGIGPRLDYALLRSGRNAVADIATCPRRCRAN